MLRAAPPPFVLTQSATPHEAAAIAAAIEQFRRDTAPPASAAMPERNPWQRAALLEGTGRHPDMTSPWGDRSPWG